MTTCIIHRADGSKEFAEMFYGQYGTFFEPPLLLKNGDSVIVPATAINPVDVVVREAIGIVWRCRNSLIDSRMTAPVIEDVINELDRAAKMLAPYRKSEIT